MSSVEKKLQEQKRNEARDLGITDFFNQRDRSARGADGLVNDATKTIVEESKVKQELYDKSQAVTSLPPHVQPLFSGVFLTAKRNKLIENGIYLPTASFGKGSDTDMEMDFSEKQIVLRCGPNADQVEPGMEVVLNLDNFKKRLSDTMAQKVNKDYEYVLPIEVIDGVEYLHVVQRDLKYISDLRN
jgi:hypothetical protein